MSVSPEPAVRAGNPSLEQTAKENVLARPFKRLAYCFSPARVVLDKEDYCHIVDARTGEVSLIEGPTRRVTTAISAASPRTQTSPP